ncbi:hypothetical protein R1sor_026984 [Riccia sorocarpa]|uniref:Uncharacterized protein n=1 Tax=Riccia sorocarpa TaxID=122646 RepID=A0ABD3GGM4_9MARC
MYRSGKCKFSIHIAEPVNGGPANRKIDIVPHKVTACKRARDDKEPVCVVVTRMTTKDRSVVTADAWPSAPPSIPTKSDSSGGLAVLDPIFHDFSQKMGLVFADVMSKRLQAFFGPLLLEAKAGEPLKQQLADYYQVGGIRVLTD